MQRRSHIAFVEIAIVAGAAMAVGVLLTIFTVMLGQLLRVKGFARRSVDDVGHIRLVAQPDYRRNDHP